jgi:type IV pilus assembly protein PilX
MNSRRKIDHPFQAGMALVMALMFLLILTILGVAAMGTSSLQEKMAGNSKDRNLAFQAAETALINGEQRIGNAIIVTAVVADASVATDGLWKPSSTSTPVWDDSATWSGSDFFTVAGLTKVASDPKYIIEDLGQIEDKGGSLSLPQNYKSTGSNLFRITARAVGGTSSSVSIVQSTYEKRF